MPKLYLVIFAILSCICSASSQITYVDQSVINNGTNDGTSWATAYTTLYEALDNTSTGEIWVAEGQYTPAFLSHIDSLFESLVPASGLTILGGFEGDETQSSQRDWDSHPTIITGYSATLMDSSQNILYLSNSNVTIDGFTIRASNNEFTDGGAIINLGDHNRIANCILYSNRASASLGDGGAIYSTSGTLTIDNCEFYSNSCKTNGGAVCIASGSPTDTVFITNCIFHENNAGSVGGAIIMLGGGSLIMTNSLFYKNDAVFNGGALSAEDGNTLVINSTIANNTANKGGGIHFFAGDVSIKNSILYNNEGINGNFNDDNGPNTGRSSYSAFYNTTSGNNGNIPPGIIDNGNNFPNTDPLFEDEVNDNYVLLLSSPIVEAGNNLVNQSTLDLNQQARFYDADLDGISTIDLGAYETRIITPSPTLVDPLTILALEDASMAMGDYDNDGDMDMLHTGYYPMTGGIISQVYIKNSNSTYSNSGIMLPGVRYGAVDWGDFDNDGDLDFVLAGLTEADERITKIYRNDNATSFVDIGANLTGISHGDIAWGDIDNDGDLDLALSGQTGAVVTMKTTKIYRNEDGIFIEAALLYAERESSVAFADIDKDKDLDLIVSGNGPTRIYDNIDGEFIQRFNTLSTFSNGDIDWGDYDNDGDLDLVIIGDNDPTLSGPAPLTRIYRNDNAMFFIPINAGLTNVMNGSVHWGDYDNDGDLDILLNGETQTGDGTTEIFVNEGNDQFVNANAMLRPVSNGKSAWAEIDGDGDLDIMLNGTGNSLVTDYYYLNNTPVSNTNPTAPTNLMAEKINGNIKLSWSPGADNTTPAAGITYNIYIKEDSALTSYAVSPHADETNGWRKLPTLGNAVSDTCYIWKYPQSYCGSARNFIFSVQAIDHNFSGSSFALTDTFSLNDTATILYVNQNASGNDDGSSWLNAFNSLQDALSATNSCIEEIWVASGTYKPGLLQEDVFLISEGITLLGGFEGYETLASNRDWTNNLTVLSGDIGGLSDTSDAGDSHTIAQVLRDGVTIDGFIFEHAYADGMSSLPPISQRTGAGLYNRGNTTVKNCIFRNLHAIGNGNTGVGGAIIHIDGLLQTTNCLFYRNFASAAGGTLSVEGGNARLVNCTVANNDAQKGGGIHFFNGNVEAINSIFYNNTGINGNLNDDGGAGTGTTSYSLFYNKTSSNNGDIPPNIIDGGGNIIESNPLFNDTLSLNGYRLYNSTSSAVDMGLDSVNSTSFDLGLSPRILDGSFDMINQVDIGAFEYNNSCVDRPVTLMLNDTPIQSGSYYAIESIISEGQIVSSQSPVIFKSELDIILLNDFEIELGAAFEANVETPCVDY